MNPWLTLESQWRKLQTLLDSQRAYNNTLMIAALGGLSPSVEQLWWHSEEAFLFTPSPPLQDSLSLFAQQRWQLYRQDADLYHALNEHVNACFDNGPHCYGDLDLHQRYPELTLVKFCLVSASCCCRDYSVHQDELWR